MLATDTPDRIVHVLNTRAPLLEALQSGPLEKRDLVDELDVSRSTVDRGLRELLDLGLVEHTGEGYGSTLSGRLVADRYRQLRSTIAAVGDVQDLLAALPRDCPFDPVVVETGTAVVADPAAPHRPGTYVSELVAGAERLWGLSRAHSHHGALDVFAERVLQAGMDTEVVLHVDLYDHLVETAARRFEKLCASGQYRAYVTDALPYGLFVLEHDSRMSVNLLVYGADNQLKGVISSESPEAVRWGRKVYATYRAEADPVELG